MRISHMAAMLIAVIALICMIGCAGDNTGSSGTQTGLHIMTAREKTAALYADRTVSITLAHGETLARISVSELYGGQESLSSLFKEQKIRDGESADAAIAAGTIPVSAEAAGKLKSDVCASLEKINIYLRTEDGELISGTNLLTLYGGSGNIGNVVDEFLSGGCTGGEYAISLVDDGAISSFIDAAADELDCECVCACLAREDNEIIITGSNAGYLADREAAKEELTQALSQPVEGDINIILYGSEIVPEYSQDDIRLTAQKEEADKILDMQLSIDFGDGISWSSNRDDMLRFHSLDVTDTCVTVEFDEEVMRAFLDELIDTLGADGTARKYGVIDRESYTVPEWDTGYVLDRERLYSEFAQCVKNGGGAVTAVYDKTSCVRAHYRISGDFIEVSIENQYLWCFRDDEPVCATPVVTGCVSKRTKTPTGSYIISYKQEGAWLSGRGYMYHVDYWMPFYGNYGIHDASWQESYGGDVYLENGSHGCINVPHDAMKTVFENSYNFMRVVIH